jgi:hypothetical protein
LVRANNQCACPVLRYRMGFFLCQALYQLLGTFASQAGFINIRALGLKFRDQALQ